MKSITKLFVIFVIIRLQRSGLLKYSDPVTKFFPKYKWKKIKIINIIQHTSGLQRDWMVQDPKTKKWNPSELVKRYNNCKNIHKFVLDELKWNPEEFGKYLYSNYEFEILGAIIIKITGKNHLDILRKMFSKAKLDSRTAPGKLPFASHSLFIRDSDIKYLAKKILKYDFYSDLKKYKLLDNIKSDYTPLPVKDMLGHSGSGGQWLLFNSTQVFMSFSYGNSDLHTRGLTWEQMHSLLKKLTQKKK